MQRVSAKLRLIPVCGSLLAAFIFSGSAYAQQSAADNIRPVAQLCLAGQPCVGTARATSGSAPVVSAPAAQAPAAAPAPAVAAEVVAAEVTTAATAEVTTAPAAAPPAAFDAAATYQMSCFACHATGAAGAPKLGDAAAWTARLEKGIDSVMVNVTNGMNAMPPKGMCMTCSDQDLRALVDYMLSQ